MDLWHIVGWVAVAFLVFAATQAYMGRREFDAKRSKLDYEPDNDPVMGPVWRRMGRSYWTTAGVENLRSSSISK